MTDSSRVGKPWLTGSTLLASAFATNNAEQHFSTPTYTKNILVSNTGNNSLRVAYASVTASANMSTHMFTVASSGSYSARIAVKDIYITLVSNAGNCPFEIVAEREERPADQIALTGSGITD